MRANRIFGRARSADFAFLGEGKVGDRREAADRAGIREASTRKLVAVEERTFEKIRDLAAEADVVGSALLDPGQGLDCPVEHAHRSP